MTSVRTCANCGATLRPEDRFCPLCGTGQEPTPVGAGAGEPASPWEAILERLARATAPRYRILRVLGSGGMAGVYLAEEPRLGRRVAIKVMSPGLMVDPRLVSRFLQEARTTAQLSHPSIVTVYDVDEQDGLHYFVMAYVAGRTLGQLLEERDTPLPIPVVLSWLVQAGGALAYAHRVGVFHRDVKPGNILLDGEGNALVTDFGIAKVADEPGLTHTGMLVGTPAYMSPEQCGVGTVSGASDQYSLGIVAYEMLTGKPPFLGNTVSVLHAHVHEPPRPILEIRPDCPPEIAAAVERMLAKQPENRFPNIAVALAGMGATPLEHDDPLRLEMGAATAAAAALTLSPPPEVVRVGEVVRLRAIVHDESGRRLASRRVTWKSAAVEIAVVTDDGVARAVSAGQATITASCEGISARVVLNITGDAESGIEVLAPRSTLSAGELLELEARLSGDDTGELARSLTWQTSDPGIAAVGPGGRVTALRPGKVSITARAGTYSASTLLNITEPGTAAATVTPPPGATVSPVPASPGSAAPATPAPATPTPMTPVPATPAPATPAPATPAPATPAPATPAPTTPAPATPAPTTPAPATPAPETPAPATPASGTPVPATPAPSTPLPMAPSAGVTPAPTTPAPTTPPPAPPETPPPGELPPVRVEPTEFVPSWGGAPPTEAGPETEAVDSGTEEHPPDMAPAATGESATPPLGVGGGRDVASGQAPAGASDESGADTADAQPSQPSLAEPPAEPVMPATALFTPSALPRPPDIAPPRATPGGEETGARRAAPAGGAGAHPGKQETPGPRPTAMGRRAKAKKTHASGSPGEDGRAGRSADGRWRRRVPWVVGTMAVAAAAVVLILRSHGGGENQPSPTESKRVVSQMPTPTPSNPAAPRMDSTTLATSLAAGDSSAAPSGRAGSGADATGTPEQPHESAEKPAPRSPPTKATERPQQERTQPQAAVQPPADGQIQLAGNLPAGARVTVVGPGTETRPMTGSNLSVAPGSYVVEVSATGYQPFRQRIEVQAGQPTTLTLSLTAVPPPSPPPNRPTTTETPPVASKPDPEAVRREATAAIQSVLQSFVKAIESRNTGRIVRNYPAAGGAWSKEWKPFIDNKQSVQNLKAQISNLQVASLGDTTARVDFTVVFQYEDYRNKPSQLSPDFEAQLQKGPNGWQLSQLVSRK